MISAITLTKNEEQNIGKCLDALSWCTERIVLDDFSTDTTVEIAKEKGASVVRKKLINFSDQRNYGLSHAKYGWVLFVDADEIVTDELRTEILKKMKSDSEVNGYSLKRVDILWGKKIKHGDGSNTTFLRLGKKNKGKWIGDVHEVWDISGRSEVLSNSLLHYPHQTVTEFLNEINMYSTLRANELFKKGVNSGFLNIIFYSKLKFLDNYFLKFGILDGIPGLVRAIMMSYYSFLVRAKLWKLQADKK